MTVEDPSLLAESQPSLTQEISEPVDQHPPRMVMVSMSLHNFKSYAGTQVLGPFHKSFSAVVGPNGSGKSNVIDALLFVFGWRASKMRQGKLSGLIHSSSGHDHIDQCSVALTFDKIIDDDTAPGGCVTLPDSRLIISRTAYRNNSSKYFINDRTSSYTEVTTLLKDNGVDLEHKRFLILQGEVESISQMKAKAPSEHEDGLLEYLEDIIGTSSYKEPITEATARVESLGEERAERISRVRYVEKEKEQLESQKDEAETFCKNENSLALLKSSIYQKQYHESSLRKTAAEEALVKVRSELEEEGAKHHGILEQSKQLEAQQTQVQGQIKTIERDNAKVFAEMARYEQEGVQLQENMKHALGRLTKSKKAFDRAQKTAGERTAAVQAHTEDLENVQQEAKNLEESLLTEEAKLEEITDSLKGKTEEFTSMIEAKKGEMAPWSEKAQHIESNIAVLQQEKDLLIERSNKGGKLEEGAVRSLKLLREDHAEKDQMLQELEQDYKQKKRRLKTLRPIVQDLLKKEEETQQAFEGARSALEEAERSAQSHRSQSSVLSGLLKLKESGRIRGINDRLGNLGIIDDQYDVAVSTACSALNDVVVDTTDAGQKCLEHLRRQQLGSCRFILLDKLPHFRMQPIPTPENLPRLFDLIRPQEQRFAAAFYHGVRDTLVAKDLAQANRVAYGPGSGGKRWRVVTLDGQLIESSGTISGGGNTVARGGMSSSFRGTINPEEVGRLREAHREADTRLKGIVEERRSVNAEVVELERALPQEQVRGEKLQMDVVGLEKEIPMAEARLEAIRRENTPNPADQQRMLRLDEEIAAAGKELEKIRVKTRKIEEEVKQLQEKILEIGGVALRTQRAKITSIRAGGEKARGQIIRLGVEKERALKELAGLERQGKRLEGEIQEQEAVVAELEVRVKTNDERADRIKGACQEAEDLLVQERSILEQVQAQVDALTGSINAYRVKEAEMQARAKRDTQTIKESTTRMTDSTERASKLTLHDLTYGEGDAPTFSTLSEEELASLDVGGARAGIAVLESAIAEAKPNLGVIEEYRARHVEYVKRATELEEMTRQRDATRQELDELRRRRLTEFMQGFTAISYKLKEMYQMITLGGNAELELVDSLDPFSEGIVFSVMPPRKSWKNISNLSGGEKTLSSLALVFALHHFKPTPIYVMDEIDAALDFRNVSIVANYIKERTKNAQFIIISLRNNMFELADRLVGIYKTDNKTKSVTIDPHAIATAAGTSM